MAKQMVKGEFVKQVATELTKIRARIDRLEKKVAKHLKFLAEQEVDPIVVAMRQVRGVIEELDATHRKENLMNKEEMDTLIGYGKEIQRLAIACSDDTLKIEELECEIIRERSQVGNLKQQVENHAECSHS